MALSLLSLALGLLSLTEPTVPCPASHQPTLSGFAQAGSGPHAALTWTLAPASQVAYVIVQRRGAGQASWEPIARRLVTEAPSYRPGDAGLFPGSYRLVTVDADGTPAFSRPLTIR